MLRMIAGLPLSRKAGVANQDRQRIERSEVIQWGEVLVGRQVGSEKQTSPVRNCPTSRSCHLTVATVIRA